jgi:CHAT domain-containing protein
VLGLLRDEEFNRAIRRGAGAADDPISLTASESEVAKVNDQLAALAIERGPLLVKIANNSATDRDRQRLEVIETAITEANKRVKLVLADVAKAAAGDQLVTQSMMQSLRRLGNGTVALYTVVANGNGWVILTTPDFRRAYPIRMTDLNKNISDFRRVLSSDQFDPLPLAKALYTAVFLQKNDQGATLAGDLRGYRAKTLMWSLDGVLRYVPMGALHDGKEYLAERYPSVVFTTASLTRLLDPTATTWRAFGLGVSKRHGDFPALPAVPRELHAIIRESASSEARGVMPGVIRLDEQFTRKAMVDGLHEGYPVVHIASHFSFNAAKEETSFLLLGDGSHLSVEEMQNSPGIFEQVELLTLSACDTATTGANGKEVEGLAFVAQDLGAKAVLATLWPVADVGTEVLMREFYRLREANPRWSKAEALRQAQVALLKMPRRDLNAQLAHPHYWAAFILIGNWR